MINNTYLVSKICGAVFVCIEDRNAVRIVDAIFVNSVLLLRITVIAYNVSRTDDEKYLLGA